LQKCGILGLTTAEAEDRMVDRQNISRQRRRSCCRCQLYSKQAKVIWSYRLWTLIKHATHAEKPSDHSHRPGIQSTQSRLRAMNLVLAYHAIVHIAILNWLKVHFDTATKEAVCKRDMRGFCSFWHPLSLICDLLSWKLTHRLLRPRGTFILRYFFCAFLFTS